jgi:hypothetical protein
VERESAPLICWAREISPSSVVAAPPASLVPDSGCWSLIFFAPYRRFVVLFLSLCTRPPHLLSISLVAKSKRRREPIIISTDSLSTCAFCVLAKP